MEVVSLTMSAVKKHPDADGLYIEVRRLFIGSVAWAECVISR